MSFQVIVMFIDPFMDYVAYVAMLKSVCKLWFVTYQGAFIMALRILDWDLFMMTLLDLLAQPHSSIP